MNRRQYLRRIGATASLGIAALAGCPSDGDGGAAETPAPEGTPGGTAPGGGTATPTDTPAETPTDTPAETPTDTSTETPTETPTGTTAETPTAGGGATNEIAMITSGSDFLFDPIGLYVEPGETITWYIDSGSHSTTAYTQDNPLSNVNRIPDGADGWNSGTLSRSGAEFTHTFEVEGTYDYYCIPHKSLGMVARLVVGEPGGVEGDPPDGPVPSEQKIVDQGVVTQEEFTP